MKYKVGDIVRYEHEIDKIIENCIILKINEYAQYSLQTIEVLDDLNDLVIRYFNNHFISELEQIKPITNKKDLLRLRKMIIFK